MVKEGDIISINIPKKQLNLKISNTELEKRKAALSPNVCLPARARS